MSLNDANSSRLDHLAVVLCTISRPPSAARAIDSILAARPSPGLVVIVDQADSSSFDHLQKFDGRPGVIRIPDKGTGLWPSTIIKWDFAKIICGIWRCFFAL